jgi:hypothetical protein
MSPNIEVRLTPAKLALSKHLALAAKRSVSSMLLAEKFKRRAEKIKILPPTKQDIDLNQIQSDWREDSSITILDRIQWQTCEELQFLSALPN